MKQYFLIFLFLFFPSSYMMAQQKSYSYSVSGKVLDENTEEPIPYAIIKINGTEKYTTTDTEGNFKIENLCTEKNTLIISCIGYADSTKDHQHDSEIHFHLTQEVTGLDEITIQAKRTKKKARNQFHSLPLGKQKLIRHLLNP